MIEYDAKQRVVAEVDSVYITHDLPAGSNVIHQAKAKYVFTNRANYQYNERNELIRKQNIAGSDGNPALVYSNGMSVYKQFGSKWTTYGRSWPGRFITGNTTYYYEYDVKSRLIRKQAIFTDKFGQTYTTKFQYRYHQ